MLGAPRLLSRSLEENTESSADEGARLVKLQRELCESLNNSVRAVCCSELRICGSGQLGWRISCD